MPQYHSYHDNSSASHERRGRRYTDQYGGISTSHNTPSFYDNRRRDPQVMPMIHQHRPRRTWPPYPIVEDEAISLSREYKPLLPDVGGKEVRFRGEIDQFPLMIEVDPPIQNKITSSEADRTSSDRANFESDSSIETFGPRTPPGSISSNSDRRYVYIPEKGVEIPLTYDDPQTSKRGKKVRARDDRDKERQKVTNLEVDHPSSKVTEKQSPLLKREPSPYAHAPRQPTRETYSGEHLLSPAMSPKTGHEVSHGKPQDYYFENAAQAAKNQNRMPSGPAPGGSPQPHRLSVNTRAVTVDHINQRSIGSGKEAPLRSTPYPVSSDESDSSDDELSNAQTGKYNGQNSPESPRKYSMPRFEDFSRRKENHRNPLRQPTLPSGQAVSSPDGVPQVSGAFSTGIAVQQVKTPQPNPRYESQASPLGSSTPTPLSSPPITPPGDRTFRKVSRATSPQITPPNSRPTSRAASPVQVARSLQGSGSNPNPQNQSNSHRDIPKPKSQMTSPLPSPGIEGASYISPPRIDVREPSPAGHHKSTSYDAEKLKASQNVSLLPSALPSLPLLQTPPVGGRRRTVSNVESRPNLYINPPQFQRNFETLQSPRAKSRPTTPTRVVSFGSQPIALPPCPRPEPVPGYSDWYNLIGCDSFAICPSCRHAVFSSGYEHHFMPSPPKPPKVGTRCGFSNQWLRMAWLLTIQTGRPDANLIYAMAKIAVYEPPCPGKVPTVGNWFRVANAENGKQISDFDVCSSCVRNLETVFPTLQGVFQRSRSHHPERRRPCDLRSDSKRFTGYIDLLESIAHQARELRRPPNIFPFTQLAEEMADIRECSRDDMVLDQQWHTMPLIPEFTVCEDCYLEVIRPAKKNGFALASNFSHNPDFVAAPNVGVSCQLYSPQVRIVFAEACKRNDLAGLRALAVQRRRVERELQGKIAEVRRADLREEERAEITKRLVEEWKRWE